MAIWLSGVFSGAGFRVSGDADSQGDLHALKMRFPPPFLTQEDVSYSSLNLFSPPAFVLCAQ